MMGHRGCRLAVSYPEIAEMQTRAVIEAALNVRRETGMDIIPEIMIPLVGEIKGPTLGRAATARPTPSAATISTVTRTPTAVRRSIRCT